MSYMNINNNVIWLSIGETISKLCSVIQRLLHSLINLQTSPLSNISMGVISWIINIISGWDFAELSCHGGSDTSSLPCAFYELSSWMEDGLFLQRGSKPIRGLLFSSNNANISHLFCNGRWLNLIHIRSCFSDPLISANWLLIHFWCALPNSSTVFPWVHVFFDEFEFTTSI